MSASSKKKLRREQEAAKLTEKQQAAQKEAKKLKLYTTVFVVVLVALLVVAVTVGVSNTISNSGIREKKTVALTVGDHEISNAELNYFFIDAVNNFYSGYGSYASMFGLDITKPLNEQYVNEETGLTWADDFLNSAKENARTVYALADAAEAAGFALSNEEMTEVEYNIFNIDTYATLYGYADGEAYLKAMYGNGADKDSYLEYAKRSALANAYYEAYGESLTYEEADLRAVDSQNPGAYSSFSFNTYYMSTNKFLTGGTTDAEGNTTYSDAEKELAVKAAETAAKALVVDEIVTVADLDAAIAAMPINEGTSTASTANTDVLYSSLNSSYASWLSDSSRKEGDKAYFPNVTTSTDEEGNATETVNGYYVVYYIGSNENTFKLANVRHILVSFEHGAEESEEHDHSEATYTDEEKAAAKATAEELLAQWKAGDANEDSFAALASEKTTDTGSAANGGLYENVYPGQMVPAFNDWCFDTSRKTGDTDIVETEYGYHVMYYVGQSDLTYRDFLIENELRAADVQDWYTSTIEAMTMTDGDTKYIDTALVLSPAA